MTGIFPLMTILSKLFGYSAPINRKTYFTTGVALMLLKYALEFLIYYPKASAHSVGIFEPFLAENSFETAGRSGDLAS